MNRIYNVHLELTDEGLRATRDAVLEWLDSRDLPLEKGDPAELHEAAREYVLDTYVDMDADFKAVEIGRVVRCANMMYRTLNHLFETEFDDG